MEIELIRGCLKYGDHRQARLFDVIVALAKHRSIHAAYRMPTILLQTLVLRTGMDRESIHRDL